MATKLKIEKRGMKLKKNFSSETTEPISTKRLFYQSLVPIEQLVSDEDFYVNFP
jgi:hypothetical protein